MSSRIHNWDCKAISWANEQIGKPFLWGETDCVSLLRGMLAEMYGEPIGPEVAYSTLAEAIAVNEMHSARSVIEALGAEALPSVAYASTGDVMISSPREDEPFDSVMLVVDSSYLFTEPDSTVMLVSMKYAPDAIVYRLPFTLSDQ